MQIRNLATALIILFQLAACEEAAVEPHKAGVVVERTGVLASDEINEASGLEASFSHPGDYFVHNDDGEPTIYAVNEKGSDLGSVKLVPAKNRDWEDITSIPVGNGHWLVLGDIGDNLADRPYITLYFANEPRTGKNDRYSGRITMEHRLDLTYPDGPRDSESLAFDPVRRRLLVLSKRDKPAHLYAVDLEAALTQDQMVLNFLGTIGSLRSPSAKDRATWDGKADWISQPTGMDITADGSEAVLITYRSLYRFRRQDNEDLLTTLRRQPQEVIGPPGPQNEAIAYSRDGHNVLVTGENLPASVFRFQFTDPIDPH